MRSITYTKVRSIIFWVVILTTILLSYLLIDELLLFSQDKPPIISALLSAILGALITVALMAAMLNMQTRMEKEREASTKIFEYKVDLYAKLIEDIFMCDDDNIISQQEIQNIENKVGVCCLVANDQLVSIFSQFVYQLKTYGVMYYRSMTEEQIKYFSKMIDEEVVKDMKVSILSYEKMHFLSHKNKAIGDYEDYFLSLDELIQGMRSDLAVVTGNIQSEVENFVLLKYDSKNIIASPNIVDKNR